MSKISESYGIDIENELSAILSSQIAMCIDQEILKNVMALGKNETRKRKIENILKSFE